MTNKILLLAVMTVSLLGCLNETEDSTGFNYGEAFTLAFEETKSSVDNQIELTFTDVVSDSRCPSDVDCFWEGEATVPMKVKIGELLESVSLSTHLDFGGRIDTVGNFKITLLDVLPYPISTVQLQDEDYEIELQVDEL